jgi:hypothetical protein
MLAVDVSTDRGGGGDSHSVAADRRARIDKEVQMNRARLRLAIVIALAGEMGWMAAKAHERLL